MTPEAAAGALVGILVTGILVFFWLGPMRWLATDWARDTMFSARDELFDVAAAGRIAFSDPRYLAVRDGINAAIRYAHSVSLLRVAVHKSQVRGQHIRNDSRLAAETMADPDARRVALRSVDRVNSALLWLVFWKSPLLTVTLLAFVLAPRISVRVGWGPDPVSERLKGELRPYADMIRAEAAAA
jgi:hypothetical protein